MFSVAPQAELKPSATAYDSAIKTICGLLTRRVSSNNINDGVIASLAQLSATADRDGGTDGASGKYIQQRQHRRHKPRHNALT